MKAPAFRLDRALLAVAVAGGLACLVPAAGADTNPVDVAVAVTGTPAPGATVTATATITVNDGSTVQSILWSQTGGAPATLTNAATDTVTIALPARSVFREQLISVLRGSPIPADEYPSTVPVPQGDFPGGLQDRFVVVGINPHSLSEAGAVALDVQVVTTSGTYHTAATVAATLPWPTTLGISNVAVGIPVVLHGKTQASYNWALSAPQGSGASLAAPATQDPEFTPDVAGAYTVTVTDLGASSNVTMTIYAGTWRGVITGQDANGRPVPDTACTGCHASGTPLDKFTPWAQSGHAEIFTQNVDTPNGHYGTSCLSCHTVGYNTDVANNGIDDQANFQTFVASGLLTHGDPSNWTNILSQFPLIAKEANIQCENCHGPQQSDAHTKGAPRVNLSSELCGSCHGEPTRHGRYQQWQISGHANFNTALSEGTNTTCAKCHTANGFLQWMQAGFSSAPLQITWTKDEIQPQTCPTCHDPHAEGTTSGNPSNATVRVSGDTPPLLAGFTATDVGRGAICMTCHNSRRGLMNDNTFNPATAAGAPHVGTQTDMLMGQNLFFVQVGTRSFHSRVQDTCVACHMEKSPPPAALSNNLGGTNHTFYASNQICSSCHAIVTAADVQPIVEAKVATLKSAIEGAIIDAMKAQIALGKSIDLGGLKTVTVAGDLAAADFADSHGQQAITITFADGSTVGPVAMGSINVVPVSGTPAAFYTVVDPVIPKAGWNYLTIETDGSKGVHNPSFIKEALDLSIQALNNVNPNPTGSANPAAGGGPGNGAGAVSCSTPYVYWAEIAAHSAGQNGSEWRTDLVARNLASSTANLQFHFHAASGDAAAAGTVPGSGQGVFEDIVGLLGKADKGSLEICSDKPLLVAGRIFNQSDHGTFGQYLDGHVANLGLQAGEAGDLLGLREATGAFRTNLSVTNGGTQAAQVEVTLYDSSGTVLTTYDLAVAAGKVLQDIEPFAARADKPDLGWGFATVRVLSGSNVLASASVIDATTNDATTIPLKQ
jgi:hypothetical protein